MRKPRCSRRSSRFSAIGDLVPGRNSGWEHDVSEPDEVEDAPEPSPEAVPSSDAFPFGHLRMLLVSGTAPPAVRRATQSAKILALRRPTVQSRPGPQRDIGGLRLGLPPAEVTTARLPIETAAIMPANSFQGIVRFTILLLSETPSPRVRAVPTLRRQGSGCGRPSRRTKGTMATSQPSDRWPRS